MQLSLHIIFVKFV